MGIDPRRGVACTEGNWDILHIKVKDDYNCRSFEEFVGGKSVVKLATCSRRVFYENGKAANER